MEEDKDDRNAHHHICVDAMRVVHATPWGEMSATLGNGRLYSQLNMLMSDFKGPRKHYMTYPCTQSRLPYTVNRQGHAAARHTK